MTPQSFHEQATIRDALALPQLPRNKSGLLAILSKELRHSVTSHLDNIGYLFWSRVVDHTSILVSGSLTAIGYCSLIPHSRMRRILFSRQENKEICPAMYLLLAGGVDQLGTRWGVLASSIHDSADMSQRYHPTAQRAE